MGQTCCQTSDHDAQQFNITKEWNDERERHVTEINNLRGELNTK